MPALRNRGFTLIELIVVIAITGILLALGLSGYRTWISNTRVRTATESIQNGLLLAKSEAIRRNNKVRFDLTANDPTVTNVNTVTASSTGTNWIVRVNQTTTFTSSDFIQGRSAAEGSLSTTINASAAATGCTQQATLIFNGIGNLNPVPASKVCFDVAATGADRPLRITVETGGAIRMCDPALSLASSPLGC